MLKMQAAQPTKTKKSDTPKSKITFIEKVIKGETYMVMAQSAVELEDEFSSLYWTAKSPDNLFLMPPFEPNVLLNLAQTNNTLLQCVEAMEVNIDGTGHEFVPSEEGKEMDKTEEKAAGAFFNEPYPNESFVKIRRKLRRSMEQVGYGYLEVLRNMKDEIVGLRNIETNHVRMVKLDAPIQVTKTVERNGQEVKLEVWVRERRFAQTIALKQQVYYREFGSSRQINRNTGKWETDEEPVKIEERGTELMIFGIKPDVTTPYFVPRWINQLPSVIGSRNAEEQNLQFLDAGGMPPAIIFVQGGSLVKETSDQLKAYLSGVNKNKNRAVVCEVQSSTGSLDSAGKVDVKTERFGSAQSQDAMFMKYDTSTEEHVRTGFRLPPLFLGKAADYNFATAQTAYMVAEAQVFGPERVDFDEAVNKTIIKALGWKTLKFKSKPITLKDVATQLKAMELGGQVASRESYIDNMNTIAGTTLELSAMPAPNVAEGEAHPGVPTVKETPHEKMPASTQAPGPSSPQPKPPAPEPTAEEKEMARLQVEEQKAKVLQMKKPAEKKTAIEMIELAYDYARSVGLVKKRELSPERALVVKEEVEALTGDQLAAFNRLISTYAFGADEPDLVHIAAHAHA